MSNLIKTKFKDLIIIKNNFFSDKRGKLVLGINFMKLKKKFVYEYTSTSQKNVFRGFHYQYKQKQGKLITILYD